MNSKWLLASVFGVVALLAGVAPALSGGTLTPNIIVTAASAAAITALGKLMDPNSIIELPAVVTALILACAAVAPMVGDAVSAGTIVEPSILGGIVVAFISAFWAKWSAPTNAFRVGRL